MMQKQGEFISIAPRCWLTILAEVELVQSRCRLCYKSNNIINSKVNLMVKKLDSKVLPFYIMIVHTGILISSLIILSV